MALIESAQKILAIRRIDVLLPGRIPRPITLEADGGFLKQNSDVTTNGLAKESRLSGG